MTLSKQFSNFRSKASILAAAIALILAAGSAGVHAADPPQLNATALRSLDEVYPLATDPVSGAKFTDPAKALSMDYKGRELRFESKTTEDQFKKSPEGYIKKLDDAIKAEEVKSYPLDTCTISLDKLGGDMGPIVDVVYKNRLVRMCCETCLKDYNKDPQKVIADLNKAIADKQRKTYPLETCVVSGEKLGGPMGPPIEVIYANQLVRFCCPACLPKFKADPATYMKKLADARTAKGLGGPGSGAKAESAAATGSMHMDMPGMAMGK